MAQGGIPAVVAENLFAPVSASSLHAGQWIQLVPFNASLEPVSSVVCVQHFDSHQAHVCSTVDSLSIRESQRVPLSHCRLAPPDSTYLSSLVSSIYNLMYSLFEQRVCGAAMRVPRCFRLI
jgi:hypothetical protein